MKQKYQEKTPGKKEQIVWRTKNWNGGLKSKLQFCITDL